MLDLLIGPIIELVADNSDVILDALFGAAAGAAAVAVTYQIVRKITSYNIRDLIREAIKNSKQKVFEKFVGNALEATITEKKSNAISLEVFCAECNQKATLTLESKNGVDSTLTEGMKISLTA